MRAKIARFGRLIFERHLTDVAGGNVSARVGDIICITPRFAGSKRQWQLRPEDVLVADKDANILEGSGEISREAKVHFKLHRDYGHLGTGVIHAHARNILVFAALARPLPPVLESTRKFGEIPVTQYAPAHSHHLADYVSSAIGKEQQRIPKHAAAAIAPYHGIFVMGKDLDAALDALERLDNNANIVIASGLFNQAEALANARANMEAAITAFEQSEKP